MFMIMDDHGRPRARRALAAVVDQPTVRRFAPLLVATVLTMATGHNGLANDVVRVAPSFAASDNLATTLRFRSSDAAEPASGTAPAEPRLGTQPPKLIMQVRAPAGGEMLEDSPADDQLPLIRDVDPKPIVAGSPHVQLPHFRSAQTWEQLTATNSAPLHDASSDLPTPIAATNYDSQPAAHAEVASGDEEVILSGNEPPESHRTDGNRSRVATSTSDVAEPAAFADGRPKVLTPRVFEPEAAAELSRPMAIRTASPELVTAPSTTAVGEVVGTEKQEGALATLGKALTMRQDERVTAEPDNAGIAAPSRTKAKVEETRDDSPLLQPFYMTNRSPAQPSSAGNAARIAGSKASNEPFRGRRIAVPLGALMNQWTMSTGDDLRTLPKTPQQPPIGTKPVARDESWTFSVPSMINPFTQTQRPEGPRTAVGSVTLTAYQEEELPAPADLSIDGANPAAADAGQGRADGPSPLAEAERLGEEPEDTSLQFLRTSTVLLEPGESQFDIGIAYAYWENSFPILLVDGGEPVGAEDVDFRVRELTVPMQYRIGLVKRVQAFIGAPVGWSNTQVAIDSFEAFQSDGGFGDIDFGATIQLIDGNAEKSHMLATISATAPTGGDPFGATAALASSSPSLGQGFWSISGNVLCIKTYDPLVFYYGVGTEHFIGRDFRGSEIDPGASWSYRFGVGFAVNDRVTLSTRFQGAYVEEVKVDRERVFGSNVEPMSLRMAATISRPCKRLVEPFVEFGLTEGSVSSYFGVTWTF